jgi:hypothetical protein
MPRLSAPLLAAGFAIVSLGFAGVPAFEVVSLETVFETWEQPDQPRTRSRFSDKL